MTKTVPAYQVVLSVSASRDLATGELEATAEALVDCLHRRAPFVALGPAAAASQDEHVIEIECTVTAESPEELHAKVGSLFELMLEEANAFEYFSSSTEKLNELALA
jgi:hypothetical protein